MGHLKILTHLANNLIESEDNLEIIETQLKLPDFPKNTRNTVNEQSIRMDDS